MASTPLLKLFLHAFPYLIAAALAENVQVQASNPKSPRVGNNNSTPLLDRLAAGHVVPPMGPRRFRRFKVWMPWYQAYTRWCLQTRAGKRCKNGDCCLWHTECMINTREHYALGYRVNKVRVSDIDENWPDGVFGTGRYQERMAYGASDHKALYHRLEVTSTRLAVVLSQEPDCPCIDDTTTLDLTFSFCAQNMPGLKGVTRLPRKLFEYRESAEEEESRLLGHFSKSAAGEVMDALAALCSLTVVTSTFVVCRCYYRKSGSLGSSTTTRVPNISRWRYRRQQQIAEAVCLAATRPRSVGAPKKPLRKWKHTEGGGDKTLSLKKSKSRGECQEWKPEARMAATAVMDPTRSRDQWSNSVEGLASGGFVIKRKARVEWATCPVCDCDFETRTGVARKSQKRAAEAGQAPLVRYFCSNECLRQHLFAM